MDLPIEKGSDPIGQYIEVKSGRYDGARGTIIAVDWVDGVRHVEVELDGGERIIVVQPGPEKASGPGDLPRELGS